MPRKTMHHGQLVMFPGGANSASVSDAVPTDAETRILQPSLSAANLHTRVPVVLSGSYRKDYEGLRQIYEELRDAGCDILSPSNVIAVSEINGFVFMQGEEKQAPELIEARHLHAIQHCQFMWLHAPNGYVGPTAALEVGFANAAGIPVFAKELPSDSILQSFVKLVSSPTELVNSQLSILDPPKPALTAFQEYYRRVAIQRGYNKEGPKECLLLMVEEVGELARALRKRLNLARHSSNDSSESHELADVFLYVVHMANILGLDLASIVQNKEFLNLQRILSKVSQPTGK